MEGPTVEKTTSMHGPKAGESHWRARPVVGAILRGVIILVPIGASLAATAIVRPHLPEPNGWPEHVAWWGALLVLAVVVAMAVERLGRRLMPLVMLLKLSMLFPDRAPSRFAVARRAGSVRRLEARLSSLESEPDGEEESKSAETILALAVALQSHDRRTRGHAERVRVFSDLLAEELQLPLEDRYRLRWAALLHDIGKLTVRAGILNKPGKLDDEEWNVMRRHPAEGARIAAPLLEWLSPWSGAIAEHHERFDGRGYPAGLASEGISLAGRIVAVADAYDTMTAARSYKKPMAVRTARQELADCAGGQFDPDVVRAFFAISLPLLLWKTGPLSFLVQLPFLGRLQEIGRQSLAAAAQTATVATVAAGVTAMSVAGPLAASASVDTTSRHAVSSGAAASGPAAFEVPAPTPHPESGDGGDSTAQEEVDPRGDPLPTPEPTQPPAPDPSRSPEPSPSPSRDPRPSVEPPPRPSVEPPPLPSVEPPPLPSVEPPPLPPVEPPPVPPVDPPALPTDDLPLP